MLNNQKVHFIGITIFCYFFVLQSFCGFCIVCWLQYVVHIMKVRMNMEKTNTNEKQLDWINQPQMILTLQQFIVPSARTRGLEDWKNRSCIDRVGLKNQLVKIFQVIKPSIYTDNGTTTVYVSNNYYLCVIFCCCWVL